MQQGGSRRSGVTARPLYRDEPFVAGLNEAVVARGLSLRRIQALLRDRYGDDLMTSAATLGAWRDGTRLPELRGNGVNSLVALELALGLCVGDLLLRLPGDLVVCLRPQVVRQNLLRSRPKPLPLEQRRDLLLASVMSEPDNFYGSQFLIVRMKKDYSVGWRMRPLTTTITMEIRAVRDDVDRYWFLQAVGPLARPRIKELAGCNVDESRSSSTLAGRPVPPGPTAGKSKEEQAVLATKLIFPPLARGETHQFSFQVQYQGPDDENLFRDVVRQPCAELRLALEYDWPCLPAAVIACQWSPPGMQEASAEPMPPVGPRPHVGHKSRPLVVSRTDGVERMIDTSADRVTYHQVITAPRPIGYGWRWQLPPPSETAQSPARL